MSDLKNILQICGEQLPAVNACAEKALQVQELKELKLSLIQSTLE